MKASFPVIALVFSVLHCGPAIGDEEDPFADLESHEARVDESSSAALSTEKWISAELSRVFKLGEKINQRESDHIKVTILRTGHNPMALTWFPEIENDNNLFLKIADKSSFEVVFQSETKVSEALSRNLSRLLESISPSSLDPVPAEEQQLGGSRWILEFVSGGKSFVLHRLTPAHKSYLKFSGKNDVVAREVRLTSFVMMLLLKSGALDHESLL